MNTGHPTFSIVTPSYNQGPFLSETIESVLRQEGEFYLDYLVMDGGSSDDSVEIVKGYERMLQRGELRPGCLGIEFRWVSGRDGGQADALVKGFGLARGEIYAWLNSDDTYLPGALQSVADELQAHPEAALVYGAGRYVDASGRAIASYRSEPFHLLRLAAANIVCQPAAFFRKEPFRAVGGLDPSLDFVMDYDLWIRLGKHFPCRYLPVPLATYRLHESSKTMSSSTLIKNSDECLAVTIRHFGWAPLTRIYTFCSIRCERLLPGFLARRRLLLATATVFWTLLRSLWLNRGPHRNDLRLLTPGNFRKLSKNRMEIMTGGTR